MPRLAPDTGQRQVPRPPPEARQRQLPPPPEARQKQEPQPPTVDLGDTGATSRRARQRLRTALASRQAVRQAMLLREIVGPPASLWGPQDGPPGVR